MTKIKLGAACLLFFIGMLGVLGGMIIADTNPLTYLNVPFKIAERSVNAGELIGYYVVRCNSTDRPITYTVHQKLESIDSNYVTDIGDVRVSLLPGCHQDIDFFTLIPEGTQTGTYRIIGKTEVTGRLRTHFIPWKTQSFSVTPRVRPREANLQAR